MKSKKVDNKFIMFLALMILLVLAVVFLLPKSNNSPKVQNTTKPISNDNSFTSIESDIDNTIILEEDFSNL